MTKTRNNMSNFQRKVKVKKTGKVFLANFLDNYFGDHYGIMEAEGKGIIGRKVYKEKEIEIV